MGKARASLRRLALRSPALGRLLRERDDARVAADRARRRGDRLNRVNRDLQRDNSRLLHQLQAAEVRAGVEDDLRYVFIVTYGRSGSTLLMGILNSIPGFLIRGENRAAAYHLFKFYDTCERESAQKMRRDGVLDATHPWFGIDEFPAEFALRQLRRLVLDTLIRPRADSRVVGFKEIRWQQKDVSEYVLFLQRVFPGAKFVFTTRNHQDVVESKWWAEYPNALAEVDRVETLQRDVREALGDAAFHVHYDDYVADPSTLRPLFEWLGEEFDEQTIRAVMAKRHSY